MKFIKTCLSRYIVAIEIEKLFSRFNFLVIQSRLFKREHFQEEQVWRQIEIEWRTHFAPFSSLQISSDWLLLLVEHSVTAKCQFRMFPAFVYYSRGYDIAHDSAEWPQKQQWKKQTNSGRQQFILLKLRLVIWNPGKH